MRHISVIMTIIPEILAAAVQSHQAGRLYETEQLCARILHADPSHADALHLLGVVAIQQDRCADAIAFLRQAIARCPSSSTFHYSMGTAFQYLGWLDEAAGSYREALRLNPHYAGAHSSLGNVLRDQGFLEEAMLCYHEALRWQPRYAQAHYDLGIALKCLGRFPAADASFRSALRLKPNLAEAHTGLAMTLLLQGDFPQGWREYEWRWQTEDARPLSFPQDLWDGTPLEGRTILLHAEQGLGDTLQFIRFASLVKRLGGIVIAACQNPLLRILEGCSFLDRLVSIDGPLPSFDTYAPLLSLPRILGTTLATIPADVPYLYADAELISRWDDEFLSVPGFRVGIVWQGSPDCPGDRVRSIPLKHFESLAQVPGTHLVSLQKGTGLEQLRDISFDVIVLDQRLDKAAGPFTDTAAVMMNLDLIVTSDTSIAHLAGALGAPVWVALQNIPAWGWLLDREDSPWYPTMRLFRQRRAGDWEDVFKRIARELEKQVLAERTPYLPKAVH